MTRTFDAGTKEENFHAGIIYSHKRLSIKTSHLHHNHVPINFVHISENILLDQGGETDMKQGVCWTILTVTMLIIVGSRGMTEPVKEPREKLCSDSHVSRPYFQQLNAAGCPPSQLPAR